MKTYLIAALALLVVTMAVFAVFSPYNGATNDEWTYLYLGRLGEWQGFRINRDFSAGGAVIGAAIMPDRDQNIHIMHLLASYAISLGLFHIALRLNKGYAGFSFLAASIYLVYIPYNMEQSRALFIEPYSWAILMMMICAVLLLEFFFWPGRAAWGFLVLAAAMGYVSARVYEGFIPILYLLPLLYWELVRLQATHVGTPSMASVGKNRAADSIDAVPTDTNFNIERAVHEPPLRAGLFSSNENTPRTRMYSFGSPSLFTERGLGGEVKRASPLLIGLLIYYAAVTVGSAQFVIPYLQGDEAASYQSGIQAVDNDPRRLIDNTIDFAEVSFPLENEILRTDFDYVLPGLLMTALVLLALVGLWRTDAQLIPSPKQLIVLLMVGVLLTLLGGAAFIYAGLHLEFRSQFMAAPGEALIIVSILGLLTWVLRALLRINLRLALVGMVTLFFVTAGQWQLESELWARINRGPAFDEKTILFRDLLAQMPELDPHTAIIYRCRRPDYPQQLGRLADMFAIEYLYDRQDVEMILLPFHVAPLRVPVVEFGQEGIDYSHEYDLLGLEEVRFQYGYDEVIMVRCEGDSAEIVTEFPNNLAPDDAQLATYNPYARIHRTWVSMDDARVLTISATLHRRDLLPLQENTRNSK